jgi:hypothetical protein
MYIKGKLLIIPKNLMEEELILAKGLIQTNIQLHTETSPCNHW